MALAGYQVMHQGTGVAQATPVPLLFWPASLLALIAAALGLPLDHPTVTFLLAGLMLLGGLPHGAFDIALAARAWRMGPFAMIATVLAYVGVAAIMATAWSTAPTLALILFLSFSAIHFGEDWTMLEPGLLRAMAGLSVIAAATIGQPQAVTELFALLAPAAGPGIAGTAIALAPVALLVTLVGLAIAWQGGHRHWALAQATALLCLVTMPPTTGFFLYFVLLHSPRHLDRIDAVLTGWSRGRFWLCGGTVTALTLGIAAWLGPGFWSGDASGFAAEGFRVLSIVAAPHLLLSISMDRHLPWRQRWQSVYDERDRRR